MARQQTVRNNKQPRSTFGYLLPHKLSGILRHPTRCSMWRSGVEQIAMTQPKKDSGHEEILSILQTSKNRLEYLTQNDWTLIVDRSKRSTFRKNDILIDQGKQAKTVYLLVRGTARVETPSKAVVAHIDPGQVCGEMAFLENSVASATVTADEDLEVCAVEWAALLDLFELFPHLGSRFYRSLAVSLSRRLRDQIGTAKPLAAKII
jgi:signal-transduction protein with cAMP-binding, CBS, and nucleotidyltransferase domain